VLLVGLPGPAREDALERRQPLCREQLIGVSPEPIEVPPPLAQSPGDDRGRPPNATGYVCSRVRPTAGADAEGAVMSEHTGLAQAEGDLVDALLNGDEQAFRQLVSLHHKAMVRVASCYVRPAAVVEEVVQETWLAVLEGLHRFERRSSLKTWIFRILVNRARTRGVREHRSVPLSAVVGDDFDPAVGAERFMERGHRWAGHWSEPPHHWSDLPAERVVSAETRRLVEETINGLPPNQRAVVSLRDVQGWTAEEVCSLLDLTETNQRVLLHRGRSKVRAALERYFAAAAR
jgi:RNA polymerase sigma-70 factor (ECF subfamily)